MREVSSRAKARAAREKRTLQTMVMLFCGAKHEGNAPCPDCASLIEYASTRIDRCPFIESKPTCLRCTVHCFEEPVRVRVRAVMRYSGPRMAYRHPLMSILHFADGRRRRRRAV